MDMDGIVEDVYDEVNTPSASSPNFVVALYNLGTLYYIYFRNSNSCRFLKIKLNHLK